MKYQFQSLIEDQQKDLLILVQILKNVLMKHTVHEEKSSIFRIERKPQTNLFATIYDTKGTQIMF